MIRDGLSTHLCVIHLWGLRFLRLCREGVEDVFHLMLTDLYINIPVSNFTNTVASITNFI